MSVTCPSWYVKRLCVSDNVSVYVSFFVEQAYSLNIVSISELVWQFLCVMCPYIPKLSSTVLYHS